MMRNETINDQNQSLNEEFNQIINDETKLDDNIIIQSKKEEFLNEMKYELNLILNEGLNKLNCLDYEFNIKESEKSIEKAIFCKEVIPDHMIGIDLLSI